MTDTTTTKKSGTSDEDILSLVRTRLTAAISATSDSRKSEIEDLKFAAGSPDNKWQWPTEVQTARTNGDVRPMLTINKLPQHIHQVTNDQRQNRPSAKVIPADDGAHVEVAEIFDGMIRQIQYDSNADVAYDTACENQVTFGEGYFRIITEFESKDSFDQVIKIKRVRNSFSVYMDPMIEDPCGEDQDWCIISTDMRKSEYTVKYPDASPVSSLEDMGRGNESIGMWLGEDTVRIVEYFYFEVTPVKLNLYSDGKTAFDGTPEDTVYRAHFGKPIKSRQSEHKQVKWVKTNGYDILEQSDWAGDHIPVIRVVGNEFEVEGKIYVSGIVRNAKDAQRMYNYHASNEVEMIALAPKAPFIGAAGQFEGFENKWKTANTTAWPYLEYNPIVDDATGAPLPPPMRSQPPMVQSGIIAAKTAASEDIKEATGQYNASLGQPSNERSAKAINARTHEGDVSTFHYQDNLARAIRYLTKQLIYLIPRIYDTKRVVTIMGEDHISAMAKLDPDLKESDQAVPVMKVMSHANPEILLHKIYNLSIGKYGVLAVTGSSYATRRQEALDGMVQIAQANPDLWKVIGDLIVKNMDWPGAQEISARLKKTIDPKLLDNDENPELQQAQQQIKQLTQLLDQAHGMLQNASSSMEAKELSLKQVEVQIKMYEAQTKRIAATAQAANAATHDAGIQTPDQIQDVVMGTLHAAIDSGHVLGGVGLPSMPSQQPQDAPPQAPPLDPNKVMVENSKHALMDKQHAHDLEMQAQQPQPEMGEQ